MIKTEYKITEHRVAHTELGDIFYDTVYHADTYSDAQDIFYKNKDTEVSSDDLINIKVDEIIIEGTNTKINTLLEITMQKNRG